MAVPTCKIPAGPAVNKAAANSVSYESPYSFSEKPFRFNFRQRCPRICMSMRTKSFRSKECIKCYRNSSDSSGEQQEGEEKFLVVPGRTVHSSQALAEACRFVCNDAKFVNDRARNDIILLSRGIMKLDARARQDVAILGSGFLKLDARAREDTEKIDRGVKRKAERLQHIASVCLERDLKRQSRIKTENCC